MLKKSLSLFVVAVLFIGVIILLANPVQSTSPLQQKQDTFEYAQLIVQGDLAEFGEAGMRVRWIQGDKNLVPQFVTVESLNRLLSRKSTFSNFGTLLDTIGSEGWELVDVRVKSQVLEYWAFKRSH